MSVNQAATLYDVPRTTLQDCVKGRVKHGEKTGPNMYLTSAAEEELASFLMEVSKVGYGKTRREVTLLVEAVAQEKGVRRFLMDGFVISGEEAQSLLQSGHQSLFLSLKKRQRPETRGRTESKEKTRYGGKDKAERDLQKEKGRANGSKS